MNILHKNFPAYLRDQIDKHLPGQLSHARMLPPGRVLKLPDDHSCFRESAVLMLLFPAEQDIRICLIRRPATMKNHAGQIALPGGKREEQDRGWVDTALREAEEEIGLRPDLVRHLGTLSPVYVQVSEYLIVPVVGWCDELPALRIDRSEVDEVIFASLSLLAAPAALCERLVETMTGQILVPGYELNGHFIWGATAMMLAELIDICLAGDQL